MNGSSSGDHPILITEAAPSHEDEHARRRRKYSTMMAIRLACVIAAALTYQIWWLALGFLALSIPLPWMAVLIANDAPPAKREDVNRFRRGSRAVEGRDHQVIDSAD
ncbi:DUF3099 domain-containing protein [Actinoalloteichus hymeniacidonis]|uniref:DUF3099 family protein n=1 Tax=Actinoalloteichus hymeniacidonis TaxID=340345 RepID=A0AAC9HNB1_9PSEU|nr:DUF3099 domain-containing protein [Actinoalloteichus hymeniacidonis]AOS62479.1 putative DUF3099 family protein [Actinoalloteichus hymeniacidonis]MBB5909490.1 hypothetical protein [Actinoalloteichus hymeniacidonis]